MTLQQLIDQSDLDMGPNQIKSFFLGSMMASKTMSFEHALKELLNDEMIPDDLLKKELHHFWTSMRKDFNGELKNFFDNSLDDRKFLESAQEQLDFFLTALTVSGMSVDELDDEEIAEILDEMEELVLELDELLSLKNLPIEDAKELREAIESNWKDLLALNHKS